MSCARRKNLGSGYVKECDSMKSKEVANAAAAKLAERAAQDAKLFPPLNHNVSVIQRTDPPDFSNSLVSTSIKR